MTDAPDPQRLPRAILRLVSKRDVPLREVLARAFDFGRPPPTYPQPEPLLLPPQMPPPRAMMAIPPGANFAWMRRYIRRTYGPRGSAWDAYQHSRLHRPYNWRRDGI